MSVALLIITHNDIGASLLDTATGILGGCPLRAGALPVSATSERGQLERQALEMAQDMDMGEGVLVLTDLFGSTPANIARSLQTNPGVTVLAGINLPMLVRILNYPTLPLAAMAAKAESGGKDGVLLCPARSSGSGGPR